MPSEKVRLGYIGAGRWSQSRLLPNLEPLSSVDLVAVSNSTLESGNKVASQFGFQRVMKDWHEIIDATDIDAVIIGTRPDLRKDITIAALDAGKHVFALNAIATSIDEAKAMAQKAQENPHLVTLVFPGQFWLREDPVMRHILKDGYVGDVLHVAAYWHTPFFGLGSQFEVAHRWFGHHTRMFGARKDFGVDSPASNRYGRPFRASSNIVLAELESGATITYSHSNIAGASALTRFEVYGTNGVLMCYAAGQGKDGFYGAQSDAKELEPISIPAHLQEDWSDSRELPLSIEADFIDAVLGTKTASPAIPRFNDGVKLMEFANAWRVASQDEKWVELPPA
jgi:predicted dehydrogenase